ncbi:hypothetical protein CWI36_0255p0020 [Hamiltosporidium magnivora]|uniref:Uncharacterized protein n=1 Tax=Hamiltosporidium magnivora TaxID=148818 RepID=A0A4Q9LHP5_9MICR|nr:hypothetical protein CWI36_0255p0020 [Hamiltosporidium magnivora]
MYTIYSTQEESPNNSLDRLKGLESGPNAEGSWKRAPMGLITRAEMHEEPTAPLKQASSEEDGAKNLKAKNNTLHISEGGATRNNGGKRGRRKCIKS